MWRPNSCPIVTATVTFRTIVTGFEGTITAAAVLATATPDRTVADHQRTVEVLTSRLETE